MLPCVDAAAGAFPAPLKLPPCQARNTSHLVSTLAQNRWPHSFRTGGHVQTEHPATLDQNTHAIKPVMIAVVIQALWGLLRKAVKTRRLLLLALITTVVAAFGGHDCSIGVSARPGWCSEGAWWDWQRLTW